MASRNSPSTSIRLQPDLLLSLATGPLLLGLLVGKTLATAMQELGQLSEELFRGDRLPPLDFPASTSNEIDVRES